MTQTLFLAWQDTRPRGDGTGATRQWYPIGRLDKDRNGYSFSYTNGAKMAQEKAGFQPLDAFPVLHRRYYSDDLFALFRNRVPSKQRKDYSKLLERLDLDSAFADPFEILAVSGGARQTDNLEVFPRITKSENDRFSCRFFLHGWRHVSKVAQDALEDLSSGDELRVALELNNPVTAFAIQMQTADQYYMIGWTPRYLVNDVLSAGAASPSQLKAVVRRVNPPPAPYNQRVLIEMTGEFPEDKEPMSDKEFQRISSE